MCAPLAESAYRHEETLTPTGVVRDHAWTACPRWIQSRRSHTRYVYKKRLDSVVQVRLLLYFDECLPLISVLRMFFKVYGFELFQHTWDSAQTSSKPSPFRRWRWHASPRRRQRREAKAARNSRMSLGTWHVRINYSHLENIKICWSNLSLVSPTPWARLNSGTAFGGGLTPSNPPPLTSHPRTYAWEWYTRCSNGLSDSNRYMFILRFRFLKWHGDDGDDDGVLRLFFRCSEQVVITHTFIA